MFSKSKAKRSNPVHVKSDGIGRLHLLVGKANGSYHGRSVVELTHVEAKALINVLNQVMAKDGYDI